jgi:hypothetical protein
MSACMSHVFKNLIWKSKFLTSYAQAVMAQAKHYVIAAEMTALLTEGT